jgi:hypothetical protein
MTCQWEAGILQTDLSIGSWNSPNWLVYGKLEFSKLTCLLEAGILQTDLSMGS